MELLRRHLCKLTLISCEKYTELASRQLDEQLSLGQRILFWGHHLLCLVCRRFRRQLHLIHDASHCIAQHELDDDAFASEKALNDAQRERIKKSLKDA